MRAKVNTTCTTLIHRVRDPGDSLAWGEFHELYSDLIYRYARSRGLNDTDAVDLVADCMEQLSREMRSLLIGEAAKPEQARAIEEALLSGEHVKRVIHLRTMHLGPEQILVAAKVEFDPGLSFEDLSAHIDQIEAAVRSMVPLCRLIYVEPDIYRSEGGEDS